MTAMVIPTLDLPWGRALTRADLDDLPEDGHRFELIDGVLVVDAATGPYTYADLEDVPEDGHRYELIDGVLYVSPSPVPRHQEMVISITVLLHALCPPDLKVYVSPLDVVLADNTVVEPDVLVVSRDLVTDRNVQGAPVLAVEVLSPSTRAIDLTVKRDRFERSGIASYWVVDPLVPSIRCFALRAGRYEEVASASGDETLRLDAPFPVEITPSALADDAG
jgi:Uma2 family endonuclease